MDNVERGSKGVSAPSCQQHVIEHTSEHGVRGGAQREEIGVQVAVFVKTL